MGEREQKCGRRGGNCGGADTRAYVQGQGQKDEDRIWSEVNDKDRRANYAGNNAWWKCRLAGGRSGAVMN